MTIRKCELSYNYLQCLFADGKYSFFFLAKQIQM
mgnify:CR=1 FL=1